MSQSHQTVTLHGVRAVGHEHQGRRYGGLYFPKCWKNGRMIPARYEANYLINGPDYKDSEGNTVEGRRDRVKIVAWNTKNAPEGKGLADVLARCVSVGKAMTFINAEIQSFLKQIRVEGKPVLKKNGEPAMTMAHTISIRSFANFDFGNDSVAQIQREEAEYDGNPSFFGRPTDPEELAQVLQFRKNAKFTPGDASYGYCRVIPVEGASLTDPALQGLPQGEQTQGAPNMDDSGL